MSAVVAVAVVDLSTPRREKRWFCGDGMPSLQESFLVEVIAAAGLPISPQSRSQKIVQIHHTDGVRDSQIVCSRVAKEV